MLKTFNRTQHIFTSIVLTGNAESIKDPIDLNVHRDSTMKIYKATTKRLLRNM